ncbi:RNA polymerase sigma-70 factor [Chitinophaga sp. YIM B06452]|uniref:RNA polymerase sigma factor n=1 Tax=Chitinophaga sp. YIM B06452 TaxID=3082158 RepID=UPI0031FE4E2C
MEDQTGIDTAWLTGLSRGEESAFRRLFSQYHPFIYSFALRMTGSDALAKDVVQEIFIKLWLHRGELPGVQNLGGYINRLTRNHVLNGMKRMAHESSLLQDLQPQLSAGPAPTEARAEHRDLEMLLDEALRRLPGQQQRVYRMSRMEGLKHEEIATALGISRETVKKHMMAALQAIRLYLRQHSDMPVAALLCLLPLFS